MATQCKVLITGLLAALFLAAGVPALAHDDGEQAHATGKSGRVPVPVLHINKDKGDECVEPEDVMRRNHMQFILHQRDKTMHEGIRTSKYSLKNCVNCHADPKTNSVLGKDGFCASCHRYAAVHIDCFECHSSQREVTAEAAAPPPVANTSPAKKGTKP
jgi:hypothetical protein